MWYAASSAMTSEQGRPRAEALIPWPNRIRDGRYIFDGASPAAALTEPATAERHSRAGALCAVGSGRHSKTDAVSNRVRIHPQPGWPGTLEVTITHRVGEAGLTVTVEANQRRQHRAAVRLRCPPVPDRRRSRPSMRSLLTVPAASYLEVDESGCFRSGFHPSRARRTTCVRAACLDR